MGVLCLDHSGYVRNEVTHLVEICELVPYRLLNSTGLPTASSYLVRTSDGLGFPNML